ncbi:glucose-6-phosphate dehydrogenase [Mycolicibacterium pyrenivorans]|uniref:glucose-6-phosphate dehydrogenase n=1 Tax=Mycolicibacterium pyrenivorans TaxID=187102 RepID=UPI0021F33BDD|nr:glucose-6-phosphate dehydrogenase [Mycolicibacterium pyrenivorans]
MNTHPRPLVILGGTGDLTGRLLLPSLAHLLTAGRTSPHVVAVATDDYDDDGYRRWATDRLARHGDPADEACRGTVVDALSYVRGDVTDPEVLRAALEKAATFDPRPPVVYLALPNGLFGDTLSALEQAGVPDGTVIAVEKPFGVDGNDAQRLNHLLHRLVPEHAAFRIDHFIAKRTVLNILGLRFANRLFEPLWNNGHVDRVEIVYDEDLGLESRARYYDRAGALRDMLQNHLLQILALVAMDPPQALDAATLASRKADALRAVRAVDPGDAVRGRYGAGDVDGRKLPAYVDEEGVDPDRSTETFAEFVVHIDNWRWAGVPFRLRTGKALATNRKEICVHFRPVPHSPFTDDAPRPNVLRIKLDTDGMVLELDLNGENDPFDLERRRFETDPAAPPVPAYATVLESMLAGESALSISDVEAEESWRIVETVLAAWEADEAPLVEYPAGSDGPQPPASWAQRPDLRSAGC